MFDLPSGTITFFMTDVEGSMLLWEIYPEAMRQALADHDRLAAEIVARCRGHLLKARGEGDSLFCVFASASDALNAALEFQQALLSSTAPRPLSEGVGGSSSPSASGEGAGKWGSAAAMEEGGLVEGEETSLREARPKYPTPSVLPLRVRIALHTGEAELRDSDYYGATVNRCARLRAIGHGGQILMSEATGNQVAETLPAQVSLRNLGQHLLKDLQQPERVFQVSHPVLPDHFPPLRSLNPARHNLPLHLSSFIGREKELATVQQRLKESSLLTLTGVGGAGKTRLAIQAAANLADEFPDGVWLADLAPLTDPTLIPATLAHSLGVRDEPGHSLLETLLSHLRSHRVLLLLDNCEHVIEECAHLAETLLRACPELKLLATSREPLNIAGEEVWPVPALFVPEENEQDREKLAQAEAVRLFTERAIAALPRFELTERLVPLVARLCRRLDGLPLAIELAAARTRALSLEQIDQRLDDRFRLLTGGSRTALPRQQTLRALIDWSYDLLDTRERTLFRRLSVFSGHWTLEAAEAIGADQGQTPQIAAGDVLDLLSSLVDKSLVTAGQQKEETVRYRLLETLRQYSGDRLIEAGEAVETRQRHAEWYLALADKAEPHLTGSAQLRWLNQLEQEHDNLRAALDWLSKPESDETYRTEGNRTEAAEAPESTPYASLALRLAGALARFWLVRGYLSEGRERLEKMLVQTREPLPEERAKALNGAGILAWGQYDLPAARHHYEQSLQLWEQIGDRAGVASSHNNLGLVAAETGAYDSAHDHYIQSLAIRRDLGDKAAISVSLNNLGLLAWNRADYSQARIYYKECLDLCQEMDDRGGRARALNNLGLVAWREKNYALARHLQEESLVVLRELGDKSGMAHALNNLGDVAYGMGDFQRARVCYTESCELFQELDDRWGICIFELRQGDLCKVDAAYPDAVRHYREGLRLAAQIPERSLLIEGIYGLAGAVFALGDYRQAARLTGAVRAWQQMEVVPVEPFDREDFERTFTGIQSSLEEAIFQNCLQEGAAMDIAHILALELT